MTGTTTRAAARRATTLALLVALSTAGCGGDTGGAGVDETDMDEIAQETRGYVDDLARMVGEDREVVQDTVTDCVPGDSDSGKEVLYNLRVTTGPDAEERLLGEIRKTWESRGWSAEPGGVVDLRLSKDSFRMGATLSTDGSRASVGGSSGCVGG
jgi:hypothetical protein